MNKFIVINIIKMDEFLENLNKMAKTERNIFHSLVIFKEIEGHLAGTVS